MSPNASSTDQCRHIKKHSLASLKSGSASSTMQPSDSKTLRCALTASRTAGSQGSPKSRSEEHTSELQSRRDLVCRLLLEKKKKSRTVPTAHATQQNRHTS